MHEKGYKLVSSDSVSELSERITELLNRGWTLVGGPFGMIADSNSGFYQAVAFEPRQWQSAEDLPQ